MSDALVADASAAADAAARRAGVHVRELHDIADLRAASSLFETVWGSGPEGVPIHSEVMLGLVHAGGAVTAAYDGDHLVGAAVLGAARPAGSTYGFIAAALPGRADRGIGRTLKLAQRAWALRRGLTRMTWTFDPLVARNGRFNLARLGATAPGYEVAFYGRMADGVNGADEADRLVARWCMDAPSVADRAADHAGHRDGQAPAEPEPARDAVPLADGPDARPMLLEDGNGLWCRVPADVVALRRHDPAQASAWRSATREVFVPAFADGRVATHVTRDGWYLLERTDDTDDPRSAT
ncbi:hypothetical protein [Agilicoccus flavus]|uniref:hypothetical protein n=1 Tax=Agilicoccus flavus TaxID=2775968 RepID=UPI001CF70889|nr:hypothetical protein [Agilicoccus flavus]